MSRRRPRSLVLPIAVVLGVGILPVATTANAAAAPARPCGTITWHEGGFTFHDQIFVQRGSVACAVARNVLYDGYASPPPYGGWHCRYYENRNGYVSCTRGSDLIFGKSFK